ncbi:MAG: FadR family transcriptional regulator [Deltaproteobacteria bacterium]|nr:FadR family transcriptional regulator [Deltaproteobacteria bacterium]
MAVLVEKPNEPDSVTFSPLKKNRYSDQIAEVIRKKILGDRLETGTSLPSEHELAQGFQVSRTVVREALRILEISGLVKVKKGPSGGIFVSDGYHVPIRKSLKNMVALGQVSIDHLFDVRLLIEPYIAREAARHATDRDVKTLERILKDSVAHMDDPLLLKRNNLNFHLLLARASGNPLFSILLESVFELLIESSLDFFESNLERHFHEAHEKIFLVIKRKKAQEAERLMREDILDVRQKLKQFKEEKEKPGTRP